ncbi:PPOX class probable F420-dependent enzyme [Motilibacter rhizosphaerae]|uniref:PPOX class probable F420-dependent enzyme n=1 Tax=Motilibacter rhizosphaerae TaxID=598652 RepID=A0A4Q7NWF1_9ACTN|nr:PPOX class F420-dependent oxidoreductase [Motilibacter rhizosphaerae]RZS91340.1 PPOX class probable F420-dependent enzyme [Motilibacter rhizosphaerae]
MSLPDGFESWISAHHQAVLATSRSDGTPQTSNISFAWFDGAAHVSVTADRAKTRNLQRFPRAVLHVLGDTFWQYAAVTSAASTSPVSEQPGDEAGRALLRVYETIRGEAHPDPDEFFAAMVTDRRLVVSLVAESVTGSGLPWQ